LTSVTRGEILARAVSPVSRQDRQSCAINFAGIVRGFDTPAGRLTALKGVSLETGSGEFVALVGKSGSGKSVLVRLLGGLDRPTSGRVEVNGVNLNGLTDAALTRWRRGNVGVLLQDHPLFPSLSALDNVRLPMDLAGAVPSAERAEQARERLALVGMLNQAASHPGDLSVGQRRRVALAQALANDPPVLLADEPTQDLDTVRASAVFGLFRQLAAAGKSIVMATRDYDLAMQADRTVLISDGLIVNQYVAEAFPQLDPLQLSAAAERLKPQRYAAGQVVIRQGERADRFYIVVSGRAVVFLERPEEAPVILNTLQPGEYFGEIGVLRGGKRTASVRASLESGLDVLSLGRDALLQVLERSEATQAQIERSIGDRTRFFINPGGDPRGDDSSSSIDGRDAARSERLTSS
jgi:putative ABC transport system ATP-binding protein